MPALYVHLYGLSVDTGRLAPDTVGDCLSRRAGPGLGATRVDIWEQVHARPLVAPAFGTAWDRKEYQ